MQRTAPRWGENNSSLMLDPSCDSAVHCAEWSASVSMDFNPDVELTGMLRASPRGRHIADFCPVLRTRASWYSLCLTTSPFNFSYRASKWLPFCSPLLCRK